MNTRDEKSNFLTTLGSRETWTGSSFVVALAVSTIVFAFGNISAVTTNAFLTLAFNTGMCALIFGTALLVTLIFDQKISPALIGTAVLIILIALSVLRGALMQQLFNDLGYQDGYGASMRILLSLSVFLPGLLLSVFAVNFISKWQAAEQTIRELIDQRDHTLASIESDLTAHLAQVSALIKDKLGPEISEIPKLSREQAQTSLKEMVQSVIRPVSHSLNESLPTLNPPPPRTERVSIREFLSRSLKAKPLSPAPTAVIFGLILLPRNLAESPGFTGFLFAALLGIFVYFEVWLVNSISKKVSQSLSIIGSLLLITVLLFAFGLVIGLIAQLVSGSTLGFDSIYLVGAMANLTLALLVGGIVNANNTLAAQRLDVSRLVIELKQELTKARQIQFQRNRTMSKWLHGPLQSALNVAVIQISRAKDSEELSRIQTQTTKDVERLLSELDQADQSQTDLPTVIQKISETWQDVTQLNWDIDEALVEQLSGTTTESAVADVLLESVFNAIKHSSPEFIDVTLNRLDQRTIQLKVEHQGMLAAESNKGLGSKIFDYLTVTNSLTEIEGQVTFQATFPAR